MKPEGSVEIKSVQVTYPLVFRHIFRLAKYEKQKTSLGFARARSVSVQHNHRFNPDRSLSISGI